MTDIRAYDTILCVTVVECVLLCGNRKQCGFEKSVAKENENGIYIYQKKSV